MLKTLPESRPQRTRRTGGTFMSVVIHGAAIAAAVALSIPHDGDAKVPIDPEPPIRFVPVHEDVRPSPHRLTPVTGTPPAVHTIPVPRLTLDPIPPITLNAVPVEEIRVGNTVPDETIPGSPLGVIGARPAAAGATNGTYDVQFVERIPSVLGSPAAPRYPSALRANGMSGRVLAKFVIDTTGRAELRGLEMVESTHELFADAVREALSRYRFAPGEVGGRKVRTMVMMPFTFEVR